MTLSEAALVLASAIERFAERRSWSEIDLARVLRTTPAGVQQVLALLAGNGWPLQLQNRTWSIPERWDPGGLRLSAGDLAELLRLLARMPRSRPRDVILSKLTRRSNYSLRAQPVGGELADEYLAVLIATARERRAIDVLYYARDTHAAEVRSVSVQEQGAERTACWVVDHRSNSVSRLLLDSILDVRERPDRPYMAATEVAPDLPPVSMVRVAYSVPRMKGRALLAGLPTGLVVQTDGDRLRAEGSVEALMPAAWSFLALGVGAIAETPELAGLVRVLARVALGELGFDAPG